MSVEKPGRSTHTDLACLETNGGMMGVEMDVSQNTPKVPVKEVLSTSAEDELPAPVAGGESRHQPAALSNGCFAQQRIQAQLRRLGQLQADVLADRDPEPLHQLRVSLRRLRTALGQFGPALVLPDGVTDRRIASVARQSSLCRDLDVLRLRLTNDLLPRLPEAEQESVAAILKRLQRERARAFEAMAEALRSSRYLKLLARLHKWQKRPRFTPLGELPLQDWLSEWQEPFTAGLFLHPGWFANDPMADALHELRKRIKHARYSLETLEPWCSPELLQWIQELKQAQDHLGELHDLQVLGVTIAQEESLQKHSSLAGLRAEVDADQHSRWLRWRVQAERLTDSRQRYAIHHHLVTFRCQEPAEEALRRPASA